MKNSNVSRYSRSKKPTSWTLLLIGEQGKTVSFRLNKPLIAVLGIVAVALLAVVAFSALSYYRMYTQNNTLKRNLDELRAELAAANKAKERALVRLMVLEEPAESDDRQEGPFREQKSTELASEEPSSSGPQQETKNGASQKPTPVAQATSTESVEAKPAGRPVAQEGVTIKNLEIRPAAQEPLLKYTFIVKSLDPDGNRMKGYTFLVLEPKAGVEEGPVVSPSSPLEAGRPVVFDQGKYFSITRFKPVSGTFPEAEAIEPFKTATVYVYSKEGDLLLKKSFPVNKILAS